MIDFEVEGSVVSPLPRSHTNFKIIGVGGAGGNIVNAFVSQYGTDQISSIAINTDMQALQLSHAHQTVRIGTQTTRGRGAGADPQVGRMAAEEDAQIIRDAVKGSDCVFLVSGLGGGTGTGATPLVARILREEGALVICFVTKPFQFEGKRRMLVAQDAEEALRQEVDTLISISNEKLLVTANNDTSFMDAFATVNELIGSSIHSIVDLIMKPGNINVDFADVRTVMRGMGPALIGSSRASGENRALKAAEAALSSPFFEAMSIKGAQSALINVTGSHNLGLYEVHAAASRITEELSPDATVIIGSVIDEAAGDEVAISVIVTGFQQAVSPQMSQQSQLQSLLAQQRNALRREEQQVRQPEPVRNDRDLNSRGISNSALRASLPGLEKQLKEQYALNENELELPALLRKLMKEQQNQSSQ